MAQSKYMTDRFGDSIPVRLISNYDRKRDQIVRRILKRYRAAQAALERVKADTIDDLATLEQLAATEADVRDFKAKGGNCTVASYDGMVTVQVKNRVFSGMDERAAIAKQLLDEFVTELTEGETKDDIVKIVNSLMNTRSGDINRTAAIRIVSLNLKAEKFRQAKQLLQDSMYAAQSKTYIYVEERSSRDADPEAIHLDIAKLMPSRQLRKKPAD